MKKKLVFVLIVILICSTLCATLSACGGKNDEGNVAVAKPDIKTALGNYEKLSEKKSDFSATMTVTLYRNGANGEPENLFVKEKLSLARVLNGDKIYANGSLKTDSITASLPSTYKSIQRIFNKNYNEEEDLVLRYLEGKTSFEAKLGYTDGNYNLKMAYLDEQTEKNSFWGATDNESVNALIKDFKINATVDMSEYLMSTGIIDLTDVSEWLSGDAASKYMSEQTKKFIYNITADPDKLNELLFKYIDRFASLFGKEDYADELKLYASVIPIVKQWISFGPSEIDATVSNKGLPESMSTSMQIKLNINRAQLEDVVGILFEESKKQILPFINSLFTLLSLTDTDNAKAGTMGITFDFAINETFSYDKASCSLENVDGDLFIPAAVETENRREFIMREKAEEEASPDRS